jgi:hypothetical protein
MSKKKVSFDEFRKMVVYSHVQAIMAAYLGTRIGPEDLEEEVARIFRSYLITNNYRSDNIVDQDKIIIDVVRKGTSSLMRRMLECYGKELDELAKSWDSLRNKIAQHMVKFSPDINNEEA